MTFVCVCVCVTVFVCMVLFLIRGDWHYIAQERRVHRGGHEHVCLTE